MSREALGDLHGKVVVMSRKHFIGDTEEERRFLCMSGFGCNPECTGNAVYGRFLIDGEECRVERYQIEKLSDNQDTTVVNPNPKYTEHGY